MYGSNTVLVVLVNQALAHAICSACALNGLMLEAPIVYKLCVVGCFCVVLPLCMGDLQKTKKLTVFIMSFKFLAITLFMVVSTSRTLQRYQEVGGLTPLLDTLPMWDVSAFPMVFGNTVFMFCQHHMLPSMVAPVSPQEKIPRVIFAAFCMIYVFVLSVNVTALVAWSEEQFSVCSNTAGGHFCTIQPMYNLNFAPLTWADGIVGIFIVAYPAMGIANFPVQVITTRNTVHQMLGLKPLDPSRPTEVSNLSLLLGVLLPCFGVALVTQDVQVMIKYVGGYAGLTIAFLFPILLVAGGRVQLEDLASVERPLKSRFANPLGYAAVFIFYMVALVIITIKLFVLPS